MGKALRILTVAIVLLAMVMALGTLLGPERARADGIECCENSDCEAICGPGVGVCLLPAGICLCI